MLVLRIPCCGVWYPQGVRVPPVKNHCSHRPKYVFLCVNSRITSNMFKTCFGQSEQVWMDEKLVTVLGFEIQSSVYIYKSLNLSPLNSKSLENS